MSFDPCRRLGLSHLRRQPGSIRVALQCPAPLAPIASAAGLCQGFWPACWPWQPSIHAAWHRSTHLRGSDLAPGYRSSVNESSHPDRRSRFMAALPWVWPAGRAGPSALPVPRRCLRVPSCAVSCCTWLPIWQRWQKTQPMWSMSLTCSAAARPLLPPIPRGPACAPIRISHRCWRC